MRFLLPEKKLATDFINSSVFFESIRLCVLTIKMSLIPTNIKHQPKSQHTDLMRTLNEDLLTLQQTKSENRRSHVDYVCMWMCADSNGLGCVTSHWFAAWTELLIWIDANIWFNAHNRLDKIQFYWSWNCVSIIKWFTFSQDKWFILHSIRHLNDIR